MKIEVKFKMQETSKEEVVYFDRSMTNEDIEEYFEDSCGGVYSWKSYKDNIMKNEDVGKKYTFPNGEILEFHGWNNNGELSFWGGISESTFTTKEISEIELVQVK